MCSRCVQYKHFRKTLRSSMEFMCVSGTVLFQFSLEGLSKLRAGYHPSWTLMGREKEMIEPRRRNNAPWNNLQEHLRKMGWMSSVGTKDDEQITLRGKIYIISLGQKNLTQNSNLIPNYFKRPFLMLSIAIVQIQVF